MNGAEYITAAFPEGVVQAAQYGNSVKAHAVYMSVEQLVPCERAGEHFASQMNLPLSAGSVCNFKKEAYEKLEIFEEWVKRRLVPTAVLHCDETGININSGIGKLITATGMGTRPVKCYVYLLLPAHEAGERGDGCFYLRPAGRYSMTIGKHGLYPVW